jgi:imidazolonepropionase-like amidohydrolase
MRHHKLTVLTALLTGVLSLPCPLLAQPAAGTRAFTGATIIDGTGKAPQQNATIVVSDGRIIAVGPASQVAVPANAERVSLAGKVIMPGLINAHGHASSVANLATYAAYGVTTVYSLGDEPEEVFIARDAQRTVSPPYARVFVAGPVLNPSNVIQAGTLVAAVMTRGVDIVKIRVDDNLGTTPKMSPDVYTAVIREAHARGKRVAVHLYYLNDAKALLAAGADFIAHSVRDQPVDASFVKALSASKVCYSPTLMREVSTYVYESTPAFFADSQFLAHANRDWMTTVTQPARQEATRTSTSAQRYKAQLPVAMRNLKTLHDAGVPIAMGTDTGPLGRFQGYFELMELEMMVDAGLTPAQAISAATRDAAKCMQIDRDVGTLETGKWADFVVLEASPLARISNIRRQHSVWIGGQRVGAPR